MGNDLERPLGQSQNRVRNTKWFAGKHVFYGLLGTGILAGSAIFALQPENIREPVASVETAQKTGAPVKKPEEIAVTEIAKAEGVLETAAEENAAPQSKLGPKIIKVKRDEDITGGISIRDPSKVTQDPRMAHIPEPDLLEKSGGASLPVRAADGRRPLDVYARPWSGARGAKVAIIIGGLGISQTSTQNAVKTLPPEITLAFAPQGNSLSRWAQMARREGHEILLQIPMEPFDYPSVDPGRGTLLADVPPEQNLAELHQSLGRITNYTGVLNYMGARFTAQSEAFKPVINDLSARGLMFVDDGTSSRSQTASLMKAAKGAYATGDLVIDGVQDRDEIMKKLDQLEASARASGSAIATGTAFDTTVEAVTAWAEEAKKRGIEIVGVSALAIDPEK